MSLLPRKRLAAGSEDVSSALAVYDQDFDFEEPPLRKARRDVLSCELETVQAELEHERSLRALDSKRFVQTKQRLEKQLEFALEEAKEAKTLMEEMQGEHEHHLEQIKRARSRAQEELRVVQAALDRAQAKEASAAFEEDPRIEKLQDDLEAKSTENESLKETIRELQKELKHFTEQRDSSSGIPQDLPVGALSEARPDVMKELNRVRIRLAESERKNRQYKRAAEDQQQKAKQLIREKELVRSANIRIEQLEAELTKVTRSEQTIAGELSDLKEQHKTVLEKFGKLKEAVYAERAKAEKALERAGEAEALAGKGSFDPEKTRVLHLSNNPVTEALKAEIEVLQRQVKALSGGANKNKGVAPDFDPNKLHQRLKESFKEQIAMFREGVYLLTGYRVEMIPDNDRFKFKVRSVFAERESDILMFQWPEGKEVTSLDLLDTEHARLLSRTPSYEYISKFHSLPAFLASVQLSLFEKQTLV